MDKIIINIFKASYGESFLVQFFDNNVETNILIDMGFGETYNTHLKKMLIDLHNDGKVIDLLVFTHIDRDHILGGIKFLQENGDNNFAKIIQVKEIWYNAYRHLQFEKRTEDEISVTDAIILNSIVAKGLPKNERNKTISAVEGSALGALILDGNYNWNTSFNKLAVCIENMPNNEIRLNNSVTLKILSPCLDDLEQLDSHWMTELKKNKGFKGNITKDDIFDDAFEFLIGQAIEKKLQKKYKLISSREDWSEIALDEEKHVDIEPVNKSSIAFVLEYKNKENKDKKILFTGDSDPNRIYESLINCYKMKSGDKINFDIIKISHHGSKYNTSNKLLEIIDSDKYIISTNGNIYGHPHIETISKIVCREYDKTRELIFNYSNIIERFDDEELKKLYNFKIKCVDEEAVIQVVIGGDEDK